MRVFMNIFLALSAILGSIRTCYARIRGQKAHMTIFVHGSVATPFWMFNGKSVWRDDLSHESGFYVTMVRSIRNNPVWWQDQPMLEEGLREIDPEKVIALQNKQLEGQASKCAAYGAAAAFDASMQFVHPADKTNRFYYTFGHLGLLSQQYRKSAAERLYLELADAIKKLKKRYAQVSVTIVTHSHGGNVVLWLPFHEDQYKKGLFVDELVMYGTPIQKENVHYASHPFFGLVINAFSDGDVVQRIDFMSTDARRSYASLFDHNLQVHHRKDAQLFDVRLLADGRSNNIDHANMWQFGRSYPICKMLDPLPFAMLSPQLIDIVKKNKAHHRMDCNLVYNISDVHLEFAEFRKVNVFARTKSFYMALRPSVLAIREVWRPDDQSRSSLMNSKEGWAIYQALKEWWNAPKQK